MNRNQPLTDDLIEAVFEHRADRAAPDGLREGILSQTVATRQGRAWALRRTRAWSMPSAQPAWVAIAVLVALVGLAIALAIAGQRPITPFRTGLLAFIRGGDVYLAHPDGSDAEVALHEDGVAFSTVAWSPAGNRLAVDGDSGAIVFDAATNQATFVGGSNPTWSPDGQLLAVVDPSTASSAADGAQLRLVNVTDKIVRTYPFPAIGGLAWSPNGRWIAATGGTGERSNALVRIDVATGEVVQLDGPSGLLDSPREAAWSPDSRQIAYVRWDAEGQFGCMCETDVFIADADGSHSFRLNPIPAEADQPSWSPDGQWVAFRHAVHHTFTPDTTVSGIAIIRPDGTGEREVAAEGAEAFAWSAEGDQLRFAHDEGHAQPATIWETSLRGVKHPLGVSLDNVFLFGRSATGVAWQSVASSAAEPALPNIAPTTPVATPAFVTPAPAEPANPSLRWPTLVSASVDGCDPTRVATRDGAVATIADLCDSFFTGVANWAWSPTGSAYAAIRAGGLAIVQLDGQVTLNVDHLTGLDGETWSPDGKWLSVTGGQTWLLRPDGSGLRAIPGPASWSPDGGTLAVSTSGGSLLIGEPDGSDLHGIGSFPGPIAWSRDGSRFAFIRDGNLWTVTREGTDVRKVTSLPFGGATTAAWSPDDQWIGAATNHGVWLMRSDGSQQRWLDFGLATSLGDALAWSPDSAKLAAETYTDDTSGQEGRVYLVNADGSATVRIDWANAPSWSPDGGFLVVTHLAAGMLGDLELMNGDGSGRHLLPTPGGGDPPVWVR
jgi:Tol biopolymer transport system component